MWATIKQDTIMPMFDNHETIDLYKVILSTQLQILATKRKGVITDDIPLQSRYDSEIHKIEKTEKERKMEKE